MFVPRIPSEPQTLSRWLTRRLAKPKAYWFCFDTQRGLSYARAFFLSA
jgi:hypothetical protein